MRRNLPVLGLSLSLGMLLWPLPASRSVVAGFDLPKFGRAGAAMAQDEQPSDPRLSALVQGIRPRAFRLTSAPSDALASGALGFHDLASIHISRHPAEVAVGHVWAGARTLFPRAPPLSA